MSEVRVIARSVARKGKENQLRALLQGMLAPTRVEQGCKSYELYEADSTGRFYFDETWESQGALDKHTATPHFKHLERSIGELLEEPFEVNILTRILTDAAAA
ncbi:MAG: putative quinol monooxygenase [Candidatus Sulfotelmatobacter sp.]